MWRVKAGLPAAVSAVLLLLAFPPFNLAPLVFVALAPWMMSLDGTSTRGAWRRSYVFGLVFCFGQLYWLGNLAYKWTGNNIALGLTPWFICTVLMALYFGLTGVLLAVCLRKGWLWALPLVWAGVEVFRSYLPVVAFPWGLLAVPLGWFPALIQPAHWGTIFLVSAWVVAINVLFLGLWKRSFRPQLRSISAACAVVGVGSLVAYRFQPSTELIPVTIGQTGVDLAFGDPEIQRFKTAQQAQVMIQAGVADHSRLLVMPEGIADTYSVPPSSLPFRLDPGLPTLFGAEEGARLRTKAPSAMTESGSSRTRRAW